jgi:hypothetical protein
LSTIRTEDLTEFVDADLVARLLRCSRSQAYRELREAARRARIRRLPGSMLRVPTLLWERHVREKYTSLDSRGPMSRPSRADRPTNFTSRASVSQELARGNAAPLIVARRSSDRRAATR